MKEKKYQVTIKVEGKESEEFIMSGKSSAAVKQLLISFYKKTLGDDIEIEVQTVRVEFIDGDYRKVIDDDK